MNDRAFRLDFFIAIAAVLVSGLTAGTLIYQTRVIGDQFSATIWPYLSVSTTYDPNGETIEVTNDGVGPALVRSAQLRVDGRDVRAWNDYVSVLAHDPEVRKAFLRTRTALLAGSASHPTLSMSSIGPSSTLRPGETYTLLKVSFLESLPSQALARHSVAIDFCYCSLNGSCWTLHASPGQINPDPQPVARCAAATAIESRAFAVRLPKATNAPAPAASKTRATTH
jgi:hypothetical protein